MEFVDSIEILVKVISVLLDEIIFNEKLNPSFT